MATASRQPIKRQKRSNASIVAGVVSRNPFAVLFAMTMVLFALSGAYLHANTMSLTFKARPFVGNAISMETVRALADRHVNHRFIMGGIKLGMTAETVQAIHPDAVKGFDRNNEPVMTMRTKNGILVAWLFTMDEWVLVGGQPVHDTAERVYRLRLDEGFAALREPDIMPRYVREYGRPLETACARTGLGDTPSCTYNWWGGDGIELQATAKEKTDGNGARFTQMTTIATNTIKAVKRRADTRISQAVVARRVGLVN